MIKCKNCGETVNKHYYEARRCHRDSTTTFFEASKSPIIDIGGDTIDLREIRKVLPHKSHHDEFYYVIYKGLGYEDRDWIRAKQMPREQLVTLWREAAKDE